MIIGSNTTEQHPVFGTMIRQAVLQARREAGRGRPAPDRHHRVCHAAPAPAARHRYRPDQRPDAHHPRKGLGRSQSSSPSAPKALRSSRRLSMQYPPEKVAEITGVPVEQALRGRRDPGDQQADGGDVGDGHHPAHRRRAQRDGPGQPADAAGQHGHARAAASTRCAGRTTCRAPATWAACPTSTRPTSRSRAKKCARSSKPPGERRCPTRSG